MSYNLTMWLPKQRYTAKELEILATKEINELSELTNMNEPLNTQALAISAVKAIQFIIGSVDNNGNLSVASSPRTHNSAVTARAECSRLAKLNPGKLYMFMQLNGAEMVPQNTISI